jgi:hypothetical protein
MLDDQRARAATAEAELAEAKAQNAAWLPVVAAAVKWRLVWESSVPQDELRVAVDALQFDGTNLPLNHLQVEPYAGSCQLQIGESTRG